MLRSPLKVYKIKTLALYCIHSKARSSIQVLYQLSTALAILAKKFYILLKRLRLRSWFQQFALKLQLGSREFSAIQFPADFQNFYKGNENNRRENNLIQLIHKTIVPTILEEVVLFFPAFSEFWCDVWLHISSHPCCDQIFVYSEYNNFFYDNFKLVETVAFAGFLLGGTI